MSQSVAKSLMLATLLSMAACSAPNPVIYGNEGTVADAGDAGPAGGDAGPGSDAGPGTDAGPGPGTDGGLCNGMGAPMGVNGACYSCIQNSSACSSPLATEQAACSAYGMCTCNCAADGGTGCTQACQSSMTSACSSAAEGLLPCIQQDCATPCGLAMDGGSPGGDAGVSTGDAGSPCAILAACCPNLPAGTDQSDCMQAVSFNNATVCQDALNQAGAACM